MGANLSEVTLNTSNVAPTTFGLAFNLPVDDKVYAQPLYVPGVAIPNQGTRNVVYVGSSFAINSAKTVKSLTLPAKRNVVILAVDVVP
jgi:hypothetical protein